MNFEYKSENFLSHPALNDKRIRIYNKNKYLKYSIDPFLNYAYVKNNCLIINLSENIDNNIVLKFENKEDANIGILKLNDVLSFFRRYTPFPPPQHIVTIISNDNGIYLGDGLYDDGELVTINAFSNSGFSFSSWTENEIIISTNSTYQFVINSNRVFVANFIEISGLTVTFIDYDDQVISIQNVLYGNDATPPVDPERTGYYFNEWDLPHTNVIMDMTIKATYLIMVFNVIFIDYDDTLLYEENVEYGQSATPPNNPVRDGFTFSEWDNTYNNITGDTVITALYEANGVLLFTVNFIDINLNVIDSQQVQYGESAILPVNPEQDGFNFIEWDGNYNNIVSNRDIFAVYDIIKYYGNLYPWNETKRHFIDNGGYVWKVPSDNDLLSLRDYVDSVYNEYPNNYSAGNFLKSKFQVNTPLGDRFNTSTHPRWDSNDTHYGRDAFNFNALPTGKRNEFGEYINKGTKLSLWCTTSHINLPTYAYEHIFSFDSKSMIRNGVKKVDSNNLRLFRELIEGEEILIDGSFVGLIQDFDNNKYVTVKIHDKVWMAQDLKTTKDIYGFDVINYEYDESIIEQDITITFVDSDFTFIKSESVSYNDYASPPNNPTKTGYTFSGWDNFYKQVKKHTTCIANYITNDISKFTYTWYDYDGTVLLAIQVNPGSNVNTYPPDQSREGFSFKGYVGDSYINVTEDRISTAKYEISTPFPYLWNEPINTGRAHGYIVTLGSNPRINNIPLEPGDWIGGFYNDDNVKKCGGARIWNAEENVILTLYGNDNNTQLKDGFNGGEVIEFRIFSQSGQSEYIVTNVSYIPEPGYIINGKWYDTSLSMFGNLQAVYELSEPLLGMLYNAYTVHDVKGINPSGWHIPSAQDFADLIISVGDDSGRKLASTRTYTGATTPPEIATETLPYWANAPSSNQYGLDTYGFSLESSGVRFHTGYFISLGWSASLWSTDVQLNQQTALFESVYYVKNYDYEVFFPATTYGNKCGRSIRLVRNTHVGWQEGDKVLDYDGNQYSTVMIGGKVWTTEDLKVRHFNNGDNIPLVEGVEQWAALGTSAMCYPYGNSLLVTDEIYPIIPEVGDNYQGGTVFYILQNGDYTYEEGKLKGLIAHPNNITDQPIFSNIQNAYAATDYPIGHGLLNTNKIINQEGHINSIAKYCKDLNTSGYTDWYLPSDFELGKMLLNKNYLPNMDNLVYWSSTEYNINRMHAKELPYITEHFPYKNETVTCFRPIRTFSINL